MRCRARRRKRVSRSTRSSRDFERVLVPALTHWNHPGFFAYFAITGSAPGVLAEFLSAALNQQAMLWRTSPAATELEEVALGWLRQLIGLPDAFEGVIYDTASISTLHALAAAREAAVPRRARRRASPDARRAAAARLLLASTRTRRSTRPSSLLGLGHDVAAEDSERTTDFRMRADALARGDRTTTARRGIAARSPSSRPSARRRPPASIRSPAIAAICARERDLAARRRGLCRRRGDGARSTTGSSRGAERADSLVVNPHKWLFTPFDLSVLLLPPHGRACARRSR